MSDEISLGSLRCDLVQCRNAISAMVKNLHPYRDDHTLKKIVYNRAVARAKVKYLAMAKTKEEKTPTVINAMSTIDEDVMLAEDEMALAYAKLQAAETEVNAIEEQCKAIKKAMGSIETEMRTFGG